MIIEKIIVGYVSQIYDSNLRKFVSQEFVPENKAAIYELPEGSSLETEYIKVGGKLVEINFPCDMVQPKEKKMDEPILITVDGGVIQDINFPKDCKIKVVVRDYDVDGGEQNLETDEDGASYVESIYQER